MSERERNLRSMPRCCRVSSWLHYLPHSLATLTTTVTFPLNFENSTSFPSISIATRSRKESAILGYNFSSTRRFWRRKWSLLANLAAVETHKLVMVPTRFSLSEIYAFSFCWWSNWNSVSDCKIQCYNAAHKEYQPSFNDHHICISQDLERPPKKMSSIGLERLGYKESM